MLIFVVFVSIEIMSDLLHTKFVGGVRQCYDDSIDGSSYDSFMRNNGIESSASSYFCRCFLEHRWYNDTRWWLVKKSCVHPSTCVF